MPAASRLASPRHTRALILALQEAPSIDLGLFWVCSLDP